MTERFQGLGVSAGIAIGKALVLAPDPAQPLPLPVPTDHVEDEVAKLQRARARARDELKDLKARMRRVLGQAYAGILEAQLLILDDPSLVAQTIDLIRRERVSATWALHSVVQQFLRRLDTVGDGFFRERGGDLADVHRRVQRLLRGEAPQGAASPEGPLVVVAHNLGPSDAMLLAREHAVGLATDMGGRTSHTAILAQALGIPAVVGTHDLSLRVRTGDAIVLDGDAGTVELLPGPDDLDRARERVDAIAQRDATMAAAASLPAVTRDGVEVVLRANIEFPQEVGNAVRYGARGIGLYRSEFLFLSRAPDFPTEEEHYRTYRELAEKVQPHPAVIRTLDLGGEKYYHEVLDRTETNPVLGLRAVRFCLKRPDIFRPQIRGLLLAAAHADVRIMIPLVTTAEEIRQVRGLVADEAASLRSEGKTFRGDVPVGAMVEVPAAAATADLLAKESDFLSIGTNDLIQYSLAVDRGNESVAYLYEPLHPAVLRMLHFVVRSGAERGIAVSLCGEMAADPQMAGLLVGLGLRELSVQPRAIAAVRDAIRKIDASAAEKLAEDVLDQPSALHVGRRIFPDGPGTA